ncbi:MAG: SDR family oxidoreductase [Leptospiraceae bacterium]|nr:SDR family oxidoreductase [Leptospiraceae bacterium]
MSKLNNKTIVITGGNSGIGYSTAKQMKEDGAKVVILGRDEEKVTAAAKELGVDSVVADVSNLKQLESAVAKIKEKYSPIDTLFVNAGVYFGEPIGSTTEASFDHIMSINFKGAVFTIEKFLPILKDGGSIISLSTTMAEPGLGMGGGSIYSASKAALNAYCRTAVTELAARKIRVNTVSPGPITTPIFGKTGMSSEQLNGFAQVMQNRVPLKRFGSPEEVAKLVAFLASDDSLFINGAEITIDGGININPGLFV